MAKAEVLDATLAQSLPIRLSFRNHRTWRQLLSILSFAARNKLQAREEKELWMLAGVLALECVLEKSWCSAAWLGIQGTHFMSHHFPVWEIWLLQFRQTLTEFVWQVKNTMLAWGLCPCQISKISYINVELVCAAQSKSHKLVHNRNCQALYTHCC